MDSTECAPQSADVTLAGTPDTLEFDRFVQQIEARLRSALMATFGPVDGRAAAVDALSWAWEHWSRVRQLDNPVGYLYRVGRTAARETRSRPIPNDPTGVHVDDPAVSPELVVALAELSAQQRTAVLLIHGFGWTQRDVAALFDLTQSTVQTHLERGLARLRARVDQFQEHDDAH